jgi:hypothetical protein
MRTALAAVGCRPAAPSDEVPGVTPLAPAVTGWFERTAVLLRAHYDFATVLVERPA